MPGVVKPPIASPHNAAPTELTEEPAPTQSCLSINFRGKTPPFSEL